MSDFDREGIDSKFKFNLVVIAKKNLKKLKGA